MSQASQLSLAGDPPRGGVFSAAFNSVADLGAVVIRWVETLGDMTLFAVNTISWLLTRLPRRDTLIPAFYNIGVLSLPVIALTGTFIGMVLAVQSYFTFRDLGLVHYLCAPDPCTMETLQDFAKVIEAYDRG